LHVRVVKFHAHVLKTTPICRKSNLPHYCAVKIITLILF
jgi:hypothetical protein